MGLLPRDDKFYELFVEQADRIVEAAGAVSSGFQAGDLDWKGAIRRLDELEVAGDACLHQTIERLATTFITPFDPEDIHRLSVALNSLLDCLAGLGERCRIYRLTDAPKPMRRLAAMIEQSAQAAKTATHALAKEQDAPQALAEMRRLEIEADRLYRSAMRELFAAEEDARVLMTQQRIYDGLEAATDRFATLSYLIEEIRLKNS